MGAPIADELHPGPNPTPHSTTALSAKRPKVRNFAAMPYAKVPDFMKRLAASKMSASAKFALQFLILTATRTNEVLNARWPEIDLKKALWTIPAERMKMGETHEVPLSPAVVKLLKSAKKNAGDAALLFPGPKAGKPLSNMVFLQALKRFNEPYTAHGFRSSFRDWAEEATNHSHAVKEAALAHRVRNKVEAAYRRTTLLEKRRALMTDWSTFAIRSGA
ncbi:MAG TPA: site-specific integrase [Parvularculaceae bacterium]|nr:site-specific integrase [Parvularculaceae bacterium]